MKIFQEYYSCRPIKYLVMRKNIKIRQFGVDKCGKAIRKVSCYNKHNFPTYTISCLHVKIGEVISPRQ